MIRNLFKRIRAALRLNAAIRQADKAHALNGHRYYVMPTVGNKGQLVIMDRDNFRKLKMKHYINSATSVKDLENECFYCTPYSNGTGRLPKVVLDIKRKQYFSWLHTSTKPKK